MRSKRVLERHVTPNPFSLFPSFPCDRRTCYVGDVFRSEKNYQCCRKYSLLDLEKLGKSTAMSKRKFGVSNSPFCRLRIILQRLLTFVLHLYSAVKRQTKFTPRKGKL